MRPQSPHASPTNRPPTSRTRQTPQTQPLPHKGMRLPRQGPLRGPLLSDEEAHRRRGLPHNRGLTQKRSPEAHTVSATISHGPHPRRLHRRLRPRA